MTVFTRTWNASYEATPANGDDASEGANRIRDFKTDVAERLVVDHSWAGDDNDGMHNQVTFADPLVDKPVQANDETYLYSKDVNGTSELFYEDEAGNEVQITNSGLIASEFAPGDKLLFPQSTVPAGWIIDTTHNNTALKLVSSGHTSGGVSAFSSVFGASKTTGSTSLSISQIPSHTHSYNEPTYSGTAEGATGAVSRSAAGATTGSTGSGASHNHTLALDLKYVEVLMGIKT